MDLAWLLAGCLAVWRLSHLLSAEDGPFGLVYRLRLALGDSWAGQALDCFHCLSLWIAAAAAGGAFAAGQVSAAGAVVLWPALSGGAIVIERLSQARLRES